MLYVLLNTDGSVNRYPYTLSDLIRAKPGTSFPDQISDETAAAFNCFPVSLTDSPAYDHTVNIERTAAKQGDQWVEQWISTPATPEQIAERTTAKATAVRADRNARLAASDWTQLSDAPLDLDGKSSWALYRETLRTIPQQSGFPWDVQWPPEPTT
jgi:hypothetical protein